MADAEDTRGLRFIRDKMSDTVSSLTQPYFTPSISHLETALKKYRPPETPIADPALQEVHDAIGTLTRDARLMENLSRAGTACHAAWNSDNVRSL